MGRLFEEVAMEGDKLKAKIPKKGWREIVSINGIPANRVMALVKESAPTTWENQINVLIPGAMAMTEAPLQGEVTVVGLDAHDAEETYQLAFHAVDKKAAMAALQKNFEGIIAMGKVAGLTEEEISVIFGTSMVEYEKAAGAGQEDMQYVMGDMLGNMMSGMADKAAGMGAPGAGQNCQQQ